MQHSGLTGAELCQVFCCSRQTLYDWKKKGLGPKEGRIIAGDNVLQMNDILDKLSRAMAAELLPLSESSSREARASRVAVVVARLHKNEAKK